MPDAYEPDYGDHRFPVGDATRREPSEEAITAMAVAPNCDDKDPLHISDLCRECNRSKALAMLAVDFPRAAAPAETEVSEQQASAFLASYYEQRSAGVPFLTAFRTALASLPRAAAPTEAESVELPSDLWEAIYAWRVAQNSLDRVAMEMGRACPETEAAWRELDRASARIEKIYGLVARAATPLGPPDHHWQCLCDKCCDAALRAPLGPPDALRERIRDMMCGADLAMPGSSVCKAGHCTVESGCGCRAIAAALRAPLGPAQPTPDDRLALLRRQLDSGFSWPWEQEAPWLIAEVERLRALRGGPPDETDRPSKSFYAAPGGPAQPDPTVEGRLGVAWNAFCRAWPGEKPQTLREALLTAVGTALEFRGPAGSPPPDEPVSHITGEPNKMSAPREGFYAYYYALTATGDEKIDAILKAVADAGKGYHNTADWDEKVISRIQNAADEAARSAVDRVQPGRDTPSSYNPPDTLDPPTERPVRVISPRDGTPPEGER